MNERTIIKFPKMSNIKDYYVIPTFSNYVINLKGLVKDKDTGLLQEGSVRLSDDGYTRVRVLKMLHDDGNVYLVDVVKLMLITFTTLNKDTIITFKNNDTLDYSLDNLMKDNVLLRDLDHTEPNCNDRKFRKHKGVNVTILTNYKGDVKRFLYKQDVCRYISLGYKPLSQRINKLKYGEVLCLTDSSLDMRGIEIVYAAGEDKIIKWLDGSETLVSDVELEEFPKDVISFNEVTKEIKEYSSYFELANALNKSPSAIRCFLDTTKRVGKINNIVFTWLMDKNKII